MLDESLATKAFAQGVEKIVVGAVVHDRGRVLVVTRSSDDDFLPGIDELPSGGVDAGETLTQGLRRELAEEVGITADCADEGFLATFDYLTGSGRPARQFTVSIPGRDRDVTLSEEHSGHRWIAPEELDSVALTPETEAVVVEWFNWAGSRGLP